MEGTPRVDRTEGRAGGEGSVGRATILLLVVVFEGALVGLALVLAPLLGIDPHPLSALQPTLSTTVLGAATGLGLWLLVLLGLSTSWPVFRTLRRDFRTVVTELFGRSRFVDLAIISAAAGLGEEILFRGVMQSAIADRAGAILALVLTSVVFGFMHYVSFAYAIYATVLGASFGILFMYTGLWAPIVAHATFDFVALATANRVGLEWLNRNHE